MRRWLALAPLLLALALAGCGTERTSVAPEGGGSSPAGVEILDGWVRATTGTEDPSMTGAFMSIENHTDSAVTLTGARTEVARKVELHEMVPGDDGAMVMQETDGGIEVPAGGHVHLQPGGMHVMLMGLTGELAVGDEIDLAVELSDGSTRELTLPVKQFTEEEGHYHSDSATP